MQAGVQAGGDTVLQPRPTHTDTHHMHARSACTQLTYGARDSRPSATAATDERWQPSVGGNGRMVRKRG